MALWGWNDHVGRISSIQSFWSSLYVPGYFTYGETWLRSCWLCVYMCTDNNSIQWGSYSIPLQGTCSQGKDLGCILLCCYGSSNGNSFPHREDRSCRWRDSNHPHTVDQEASKPAPSTHVDLEIQSEPEVLGRCWKNSLSWSIVELWKSLQLKTCRKFTLPVSSVKEGHWPWVMPLVNRSAIRKYAQYGTPSPHRFSQSQHRFSWPEMAYSEKAAALRSLQIRQGI